MNRSPAKNGPSPGDLVHVDVKKLALIAPGGGWKVHGRAQSRHGRWQHGKASRAGWARRGAGRPGYGFVHSAIDDRSRLADSEVHDDDTTDTTLEFRIRALDFHACHGITVSEVISDNGSNYRSRNWAQVNAGLGIAIRRTRLFRPQTNGKVERYQRTLRDE